MTEKSNDQHGTCQENRLKVSQRISKKEKSLESRLNYYEIQGTPSPIRYSYIPGCGLTEFIGECGAEYGSNDGDGLTD